eukprot:7759748-Alexandrium_andersonii.AAC.1
MSASLVGSEMCIRDRRSAPQCAEPTPHGLRRLSVSEPWIRTFPLAGPVSYTHLTLPTICSV